MDESIVTTVSEAAETAETTVETSAPEIVEKAQEVIEAVADRNVDRNFLETLIDKFSGGPVGLDTLAAAISEDPGTIEDLVEPYLLQNGLINRTPRGRVATPEAYIHLNKTVSITQEKV